jgi:hypothetical protein
MLAQMENALDKIMRLARSGSHRHGQLTTYEDDLPPDLADHIESTIARLRERIATMAAEFRLEPRRLSRARHIRAVVTAELVHIEDSYARGLRGYGEVAPELASVLDPYLRELRGDWIAIAVALDRP